MKPKRPETQQQIGELARSLGVTTRTLRLYEQRGPIEPVDSHTDATRRKIGKLPSLARDIPDFRKAIVEYCGIPR